MPLYAVIGFDHPPHSMELRDMNRQEHRAYELANDQGTRLAGALYDANGNQCGTLKIVEADNAAEVWDWYGREPFFNHDVYQTLHVIEWRLALNRLQQMEWAAEHANPPGL